MYLLSLNKAETCQELSLLLNQEIQIKPLFIGYGVFIGKIMFGIYVHKKFHLKATGRLAKLLERLGAIVWYYSSRKNMCSQSKYYSLPETLYQNPNLIRRLIIASCKQIEREQHTKQCKPKSQLRTLPNLTVRHERTLAKVNITTVDELKKIGAINAFIALKKAGFDVTVAWFLLLVAALQGKLVQVLTATERELAFNQLNEQLAQENMRAISSKEFYSCFRY